MLHDLIAIEKREESSVDEYGSIVKAAWTEVLRQRASFKYLRAGESVQASRLQGQQPAVVSIRASDAANTITPSMRLRDLRRDVAYNIKAAVLTDDRRYVEITCVSGEPDAG